MLSYYSIFKKAPIHRIDIHIETKPDKWTDPDLSEEELQFVATKLADFKEDCRISKHNPILKFKNSHFTYSIIKIGLDLYAINKGLKHNQHLGKGAYGKIKLIKKMSVNAHHYLALKVHKKMQQKIYSEQNQQECKQQITYSNVEHLAEREFEILSLLNRSHGSLILNKENINFIMDYAPGVNLYEFLLSEYQAPVKKHKIRYYDIMINILKEILYLNIHGILHLDLKPHNIMLDLLNNRVKLVDFGLALRMNHCKTAYYRSRRYAEKYRAPEIEETYKRNRAIHYSYATEIFALGKIFQEIIGFATIDDTLHINRTAFRQTDDIYYYLKKMISSKEDRPTVEQAIHFFERQRARCLENVGILHIEDYVKSKQNENEKEAMITSLSFFDEIYLTDEMKAEKPAYSLYYSEVRKELEERNILVANQIYISEDTHYLKKMIPAIVTLNHDKIKVHFIKSQHKEENHKHSPKT